MSMKMPMINQCGMMECAYNSEKNCHALAITVGGSNPFCDTYMDEAQKGGDIESIGGVGACKVMNCIHNSSLECIADNIQVGSHAGKAECNTFQERM